jgi:hypothetical protein
VCQRTAQTVFGPQGGAKLHGALAHVRVSGRAVDGPGQTVGGEMLARQGVRPYSEMFDPGAPKRLINDEGDNH